MGLRFYFYITMAARLQLSTTAALYRAAFYKS